MDAGPIAFQRMFPIAPGDNALSISLRCISLGVELLKLLPEAAAISPAAIPSEPQDLSRREYFRKGIPQGALLRWNTTARQIVNFVRACDYGPFPSPWGTPRTSCCGREIGVARASLTPETADALPAQFVILTVSPRSR
jgi:methionyl-tRNA formyltransferase